MKCQLSGSAFSLVRPGLKFPTNSGSTPTQSPPGGGVLALSEASAPGGVAEDLGSSPLQRMQSITNSLLSQTSTPAMPASNQRQAKAVLPPITQQQFDQYNNLNTEDIVKKVRSQRSKWRVRNHKRNGSNSPFTGTFLTVSYSSNSVARILLPMLIPKPAPYPHH